MNAPGPSAVQRAARPGGSEAWTSLGSLRRRLTEYAAFLAAIEALTLGASLLRLAIGRGVALAILLAALGLGALAGARLSPEHAEPRAEGDGSARVRVAVALLVAAFLGLFALAWFVPELTCDGNAYHIPPTDFWARRGYVHWIDTPWSGLFNGYPKGLELLGWIFATASGSSRFLGTYNLIALPLGVLAAMLLARRLGASPLHAVLAGALLLTVPVHLRQAPTAYVDSGFAAFCMAFVATTVLAIGDLGAPSAGSRSTSLRALVPIGLTGGLALGTKPSALALVGIGCAVWGIGGLIRRRDRRAAAPRELAAGAAVILGLAFTIGGYWYVRNFLHEGSPIFPAGLRALGHVIFPGEPASIVMNEAGTTPPQFQGWSGAHRVAFTWLQGLSAWPRSIDGYESRLGGLGYLWFFGCVPAIVATALRVRRDASRRTDFAALFAIVALSFVVFPMNWWARYTVWIYVLGLPCFAAIASGLHASATGLARHVARAWVLAVVLIALAEGGLSLRSLSAEARATAQPDELFPETRGTVMDAVLGGHDAVAVGPMVGQTASQRWKHNVYGALSLPLGARVWLQAPDAAAILRNVQGGARVRYALWDDGLALPDALRLAAERVEHVPGFYVLTMPR
jgi:hypothetical protein